MIRPRIFSRTKKQLQYADQNGISFSPEQLDAFECALILGKTQYDNANQGMVWSPNIVSDRHSGSISGFLNEMEFALIFFPTKVATCVFQADKWTQVMEEVDIIIDGVTIQCKASYNSRYYELDGGGLVVPVSLCDGCMAKMFAIKTSQHKWFFGPTRTWRSLINQEHKRMINHEKCVILEAADLITAGIISREVPYALR